MLDNSPVLLLWVKFYLHTSLKNSVENVLVDSFWCTVNEWKPSWRVFTKLRI